MRIKTSILSGKSVLVTRTESQAQELSDRLTDHGAVVIEVPVIEFGEPPSWQDLDTALGALSKYDWIVYASSNAVSAVHKRLAQLGLSWPSGGRPRVAVIGSATGKKLLEYGIFADFQPTSFVAERFMAEFSSMFELQDSRVLWPRTNIGRTLIADQLRLVGAGVDLVESYTTNLPWNAEQVSADLARLIDEKKIDVITLASSQTAKNFYQLLKTGMQTYDHTTDGELDLAIRRGIAPLVLAVIGPVTAETTRQLFDRVDVEANPFNADGLVASLLRFYGQSPV